MFSNTTSLGICNRFIVFLQLIHYECVNKIIIEICIALCELYLQSFCSISKIAIDLYFLHWSIDG